MTMPRVFLKEVRVELDKVVWPTREQVIKLTALVIFVSVAAGVFLGAVDFAFTWVMEQIL